MGLPGFGKRHRSDKDLVVHFLAAARSELSAACGALIVARTRGAHGGAQVWLDLGEEILLRLEDLQRSVGESQGWAHDDDA